MYTYIMWTHSFLPFLLFSLLPSLYWAGASCLPELSSPSWFLLWFLLSFFDYYCPLMAILSYAVFEAGMLPQILLPEETNFLNGECLPHTLEVWEIPTMLYPHRSSICLHNLKTPELQLSCWRKVSVAIKCDIPRERAKRLQRLTPLFAWCSKPLKPRVIFSRCHWGKSCLYVLFHLSWASWCLPIFYSLISNSSGAFFILRLPRA